MINKGDRSGRSQEAEDGIKMLKKGCILLLRHQGHVSLSRIRLSGDETLLSWRDAGKHSFLTASCECIARTFRLRFKNFVVIDDVVQVLAGEENEAWHEFLDRFDPAAGGSTASLPRGPGSVASIITETRAHTASRPSRSASRPSRSASTRSLSGESAAASIDEGGAARVRGAGWNPKLSTSLLTLSSLSALPLPPPSASRTGAPRESEDGIEEEAGRMNVLGDRSALEVSLPVGEEASYALWVAAIRALVSEQRRSRTLSYPAPFSPLHASAGKSLRMKRPDNATYYERGRDRLLILLDAMARTYAFFLIEVAFCLVVVVLGLLFFFLLVGVAGHPGGSEACKAINKTFPNMTYNMTSGPYEYGDCREVWQKDAPLYARECWSEITQTMCLQVSARPIYAHTPYAHTLKAELS